MKLWPFNPNTPDLVLILSFILGVGLNYIGYKILIYVTESFVFGGAVWYYVIMFIAFAAGLLLIVQSAKGLRERYLKK